MPCYQINLISVDLGCTNAGILKTAIESLGWKLHSDGKTVITPQGRIFLDGKGMVSCENALMTQVNQLRVQCSKTAVALAARKCGWHPTKKTENKYTYKKGG